LQELKEEEHRVPAGFKLSRLIFGMQEHGGIAGWQLIWTADGAKDIESVKRGNWNLVGLNVLVCYGVASFSLLST
jgi:hypothetical protein